MMKYGIRFWCVMSCVMSEKRLKGQKKKISSDAFYMLISRAAILYVAPVFSRTVITISQSNIICQEDIFASFKRRQV